MGRIKTSFVKHVAKDLIERYPDKFSVDYEKNKADLAQVMTFESKRMRNIVAGYLSVLRRQQKG
jgi:small subunit ribosomal protein S17e